MEKRSSVEPILQNEHRDWSNISIWQLMMAHIEIWKQIDFIYCNMDSMDLQYCSPHIVKHLRNAPIPSTLPVLNISYVIANPMRKNTKIIFSSSC